MKVIIAGDFCPRYRVKDCLEQSDFQTVLGEIKGLLSSLDYSIVNFECPIVENPATAIEKSGPNLCCSTTGLEAIKWAGFDCVTLANNHFRDYGDDGVRQTLEGCKQLSVDTVGGGSNYQEAANIFYKRPFFIILLFHLQLRENQHLN